MKWFSIISLTAMLLVACDKEVCDESTIEGHYTGRFYRVGPHIKTTYANVSLHLNENKFSGTSDKRNYPAICSGTFEVKDSKIAVQNSCFFTADFDWTYIFKGEYNYELTDSILKISKDYGNGLFDIYELRKQD